MSGGLLIQRKMDLKTGVHAHVVIIRDDCDSYDIMINEPEQTGQ